MNDTLKAAGRIGAELGAAKAENDRLRGLLRDVRVLLANSSYKISGTAAFLSSIDNALSQQPEPTDTYTAVDMATAAAQWFRDGQAAVEQAAVQDEQQPKTVPEGWLIELGFDVLDRPFRFVDSKSHTPTIKVILPACEPDDSSSWDLRDEIARRIGSVLSAPIAQTEQQPVATWMGTDWNAQQQLIAHLCKLEPGTDLYAAPIAQAAPHAPCWRDMATAPRDGTLVQLLVEFDENATDDTDGPAPTIGANNFKNDGEDRWQFAGWCWSHDRFTEGHGTPVGWLPMAAPIAQTAPQGKFRMGDLVRKTSGSEWQGRICGTYSTALTPEGYAVESEAHAGSVQIYPAKALEAVE